MSAPRPPAGSTAAGTRAARGANDDEASGRFGEYGGRYVPETLIPALDELDAAWRAARVDPAFLEPWRRDLAEFGGRPTPLTLAENLGRTAGGADIYLKREDLLHTGAHKLNNTLGQVRLARSMGKRRVIAETGAGQHAHRPPARRRRGLRGRGGRTRSAPSRRSSMNPRCGWSPSRPRASASPRASTAPR